MRQSELSMPLRHKPGKSLCQEAALCAEFCEGSEKYVAHGGAKEWLQVSKCRQTLVFDNEKMLTRRFFSWPAEGLTASIHVTS